MNTQFLIEKLKTTVRLEFQSLVGIIFKEIFGFKVKDNGSAANEPDHEIFYGNVRVFITECKGFEDTNKRVGIRDLDQIIRYSTAPKYKKSYGFLVTNTSFSTKQDFLKRTKTNKILLLDIFSLEKLAEAKDNFLLIPQEIKIILLNSVTHGTFLLPLTIQEIEKTKYFERNYLFDAYVVIILILENNYKKLGYINLDQITTYVCQLSRRLNLSNSRMRNIVKNYRKILQNLEEKKVIKIKNNSVFWISKISGEEILKEFKVISIPYYSNLLRKVEKINS